MPLCCKTSDHLRVSLVTYHSSMQLECTSTFLVILARIKDELETPQLSIGQTTGLHSLTPALSLRCSALLLLLPSLSSPSHTANRPVRSPLRRTLRSRSRHAPPTALARVRQSRSCSTLTGAGSTTSTATTTATLATLGMPRSAQIPSPVLRYVYIDHHVLGVFTDIFSKI